jgi:hypothetical protein
MKIIELGDDPRGPKLRLEPPSPVERESYSSEEFFRASLEDHDLHASVLVFGGYMSLSGITDFFEDLAKYKPSPSHPGSY